MNAPEFQPQQGIPPHIVNRMKHGYRVLAIMAVIAAIVWLSR